MSYSYMPVNGNTSNTTDDISSTVNKEAAHKSQRSPARAVRAIWYIIWALGIISLLTIFVFTPRPWQETKHYTALDPKAPGLSCGNSSAEAMEAGCLFDIMSFTWSWPACFDQQLMDEFLLHSNWTWWFDAEGGMSVPSSEVAAGHHSELYVTWEYHLVHCTYMWKKMHQAILQGRPLDSYIANLNHTLHCEMMLLKERKSLSERNTIIKVKYPSCPIR